MTKCLSLPVLTALTILLCSSRPSFGQGSVGTTIGRDVRGGSSSAADPLDRGRLRGDPPARRENPPPKTSTPPTKSSTPTPVPTKASTRAELDRIAKDIDKVALAIAVAIGKAAYKGINVNPFLFAAKQFLRPSPAVDEATEQKHLKEAKDELARRKKAEADLNKLILP